MNAAKRKRLEAAGWSFGSTADFLELSPEEAAFVELKLRLSDNLKRRRKNQKLSQDALAKKIKSSQSRVAKMEAGDPTVSIDLLIRALLAMGATHRDLARAVAPSGK
jgi:DNA-binding XRE family transcriptional regulator